MGRRNRRAGKRCHAFDSGGEYPRPAGADRFAEKTILIDSLAIMLAIVLQSLALRTGFGLPIRRHAPPAPVGLFGTHRARGLVHPDPYDHFAWRRRMDRGAPARPLGASGRIWQTFDDPGGVARLEMAVYLSRPEHCDHQYA